MPGPLRAEAKENKSLHLADQDFAYLIPKVQHLGEVPVRAKTAVWAANWGIVDFVLHITSANVRSVVPGARNFVSW